MKLTFQEIINGLNQYWAQQGCSLLQPYDSEVGAGTFHPATCLRSLGAEPWFTAYVQPSRRPTDGRYGKNPNRLQHYYQYQVLLKPSPDNMQQLYLGSLEALGIDLRLHDLRFIEDDWESPTLGAWGLGWEVWLDGMEVTQYTYFQQVGGIECSPISGELTYGIERLAMYLQEVDNVYDLVWSKNSHNTVHYADIYLQNEQQQSTYNFEYADIDNLREQFNHCEKMCHRLVENSLPLPAYDQVIKASHYFNLLDARRALSVTERQLFIFKVRKLTSSVAKSYISSREEMNFPMGLVKQEANRQTPSVAFEIRAKKSDLLFELGCEELPHPVIDNLSRQLKTLVEKKLNDYKLPFSELNLYSTPRRLAIVIQNLNTSQESCTRLRKGPQTTASQVAVDGFARSCQTSSDNLTKNIIDGIEYFTYETRGESRATASLIPQLLTEVFQQLQLPKSMLWGNSSHRFPRPVRWVCLVYNDKLIPTKLFNLDTVNYTYGHRFLSKKNIRVNAQNYLKNLAKNQVLADREVRKTSIKQQLNKIASSIKAKINLDEKLLEEVTDLVEFPVAVLGSFPKNFLNLPKECLISTLQSHQKYFTLLDSKNNLLAKFITISNVEANETVCKGNERVVVPRLSDADYFWKNDTQQKLSDFNPKLKTLIFAQSKKQSAGNIHQKVKRIKDLATFIAKNKALDISKVERSCELCKCDLVTDFVREFPELQGTIGYYYALNDKENQEIAQAIKEHYYPRFSNDKTAQSKIGGALAIADKLDTVVSIFSIGLQPNGNKDPFALRRAGLGLMRTLIEHQYHIPLEELIKQTISTLNKQLKLSNDTKLATNIEDFLWQRIQTWYSQYYHIPTNQIQAVAIVKPDTPNDFNLRIQALSQFSKLPEAHSLSENNLRIKNILNQKAVSTSKVNTKLFTEEAESKLYKKMISLTQNNNHYLDQLQQLARLKEPLDNFFNHVMVMDKDPQIQQNRLSILSQLREKFLKIADISLLQS